MTTGGRAPTPLAGAGAPSGRVTDSREEGSRLSTGWPGLAGRRELRDWATRELAAAGCVSAQAEADWLLEEAADEAALRPW